VQAVYCKMCICSVRQVASLFDKIEKGRRGVQTLVHLPAAAFYNTTLQWRWLTHMQADAFHLSEFNPILLGCMIAGRV
jgi:hypothetical protein